MGSSRTPSHQGAKVREISELTTERLSIYLRCLNVLQSMSVDTISSQELARRFHLNSAQIRKDLACFGELGIRGVGYNVATLRHHLIRTLGIDTVRNVVIIGAGNLGMALADYKGFNSDGFRVVAMFDDDPQKQGRESREGIPIRSTEEMATVVAEQGVQIGIIAVPAHGAQDAYDRMLDAGVEAVLNFAPMQIRPRPGVKLKCVDLRINLESLAFSLTHALPDSENCLTS